MDDDVDEGTSPGDPRNEEWKIQKRKGFLKDREDKANLIKQAKISKTAKRNSKTPMSDIFHHVTISSDKGKSLLVYYYYLL